MHLRLTAQDLGLATLLFGGAGLILLLPLLLLFRDPAFQRAALAVGVASALFWGALAIVAIFGFWELYYRHFYPAWARWLIPLNVLLYGAIGLGMWWLALRLPGPAVMCFVLLGGVEGIVEHLVGVYGFHILEKVDWLQGLSVLPVVVFSFFEYVLYWTLVAWLALGLVKVGGLLRG